MRIIRCTEKPLKLRRIADPGLGQFDQLSNTKFSWGYTLGCTLNCNNVFNGWDMAVPITFQHLVKGQPAVAGSFGA